MGIETEFTMKLLLLVLLVLYTSAEKPAPQKENGAAKKGFAVGVPPELLEGGLPKPASPANRRVLEEPEAPAQKADKAAPKEKNDAVKKGFPVGVSPEPLESGLPKSPYQGHRRELEVPDAPPAPKDKAAPLKNDAVKKGFAAGVPPEPLENGLPKPASKGHRRELGEPGKASAKTYDDRGPVKDAGFAKVDDPMLKSKEEASKPLFSASRRELDDDKAEKKPAPSAPKVATEKDDQPAAKEAQPEAEKAVYPAEKPAEAKEEKPAEAKEEKKDAFVPHGSSAEEWVANLPEHSMTDKKETDKKERRELDDTGKTWGIDNTKNMQPKDIKYAYDGKAAAAPETMKPESGMPIPAPYPANRLLRRELEEPSVGDKTFSDKVMKPEEKKGLEDMKNKDIEKMGKYVDAPFSPDH